MLKKTLQPIIYAGLIISGIAIGSLNNRNLPNETANNLLKINNIIRLIQDHYVDTLNLSNLKEETISAMLNELDPHSAYIPAKNIQTVEEGMQGKFSGIGIEFNIIEDSIVVVSPISGGPSEKLGIQSGDRIVQVEKEDVAGTEIKNDEVIKLLRGEKGTTVNIMIKRRSERNLMPFSIIRDDIPLHSIDAGFMLKKDIGYIKINRFAATTYNEMMDKISLLKKQNLQKLVLDLRNNPGGYLQIANQICDEFLQNNELIVFTEGRNRKKEEIYATKNGQLEDLEIIVLINEGSASASEIIAGALQDNDRGTIIGRRSFGKGLVQEQINLADGSAIRLTTQRYYTPSGRCIQKDYSGNKKDYYLEQYTRNETSKNLDSLKYTTKKGRVVYGGGGITPDIIIDRDSTTNYIQINKMLSKGWVNSYCLEKSESFKQQNLINYQQIDPVNIYKEYLAFIQKKEHNFNLSLKDKELRYFKNLLIATTARTLWGNDVYYQVLSQEDEFIQKAIILF